MTTQACTSEMKATCFGKLLMDGSYYCLGAR